MNNSFWKNHENYEKRQRHQTCNNRKAKKLSTINSKLSYYEVIQSLLTIEKKKAQIFMNKSVFRTVNTRTE